jgi:hypothetical protein
MVRNRGVFCGVISSACSCYAKGEVEGRRKQVGNEDVLMCCPLNSQHSQHRTAGSYAESLIDR